MPVDTLKQDRITYKRDAHTGHVEWSDEVRAALATITPMHGRMLTTYPEVQEVAYSDTIILPDTARRREYGLVARVLKRGPGVNEAISDGSLVVIGEFAGIPLADYPFWMIGDGDVMAIVEDAGGPTAALFTGLAV